MSRIVTEFLERLDLEDAIVCFNDWGGAQTMVASGGVERVGGLVLLSLMRGWLEPLKRREIRRDLRRYVTDVRHGRRLMREATPALRSFERPVLVVWDAEGKMMPSAEAVASPNRSRTRATSSCPTATP